MKTRIFSLQLLKDQLDIVGNIVKAGTIVSTPYVYDYDSVSHAWSDAYAPIGNSHSWIWPSSATLIKVEEEERVVTVTNTVLYKKPE